MKEERKNLDKRLAALERAHAGSRCHDPDPFPLHRLSSPELTELAELIRRAEGLQEDPAASMGDTLRLLSEGEQDRIVELVRKARGEEV